MSLLKSIAAFLSIACSTLALAGSELELNTINAGQVQSVPDEVRTLKITLIIGGFKPFKNLLEKADLTKIETLEIDFVCYDPQKEDLQFVTRMKALKSLMLTRGYSKGQCILPKLDNALDLKIPGQSLFFADSLGADPFVDLTQSFPNLKTISIFKNEFEDTALSRINTHKKIPILRF
jgi:hypothetical protein